MVMVHTEIHSGGGDKKEIYFWFVHLSLDGALTHCCEGNKCGLLHFFAFDLSRLIGRQVHLSNTRIACGKNRFYVLGKSHSAQSTVTPMTLVVLYFT